MEELGETGTARTPYTFNEIGLGSLVLSANMSLEEAIDIMAEPHSLETYGTMDPHTIISEV